MKLLVLTPWCPYPADNGARLRISHLLRGLSGRHEITLVTLGHPEQDEASVREALSATCREVILVPERRFNRRSPRALAGLLARQPRWLVDTFDPELAALVQRRAPAHDVTLACTLYMLPYLRYAGPSARVVEELELGLYHDHARSSARARLTWWKLTRYLSAELRHCGGCTVASAPEQALLAPLAPRQLPITVVANGVDTSAYQPRQAPPEPDRLIYSGALSYDANADAVRHFIADILPLIRQRRPQTRLMVTGRATTEQRAALPPAPEVSFTGYLPDIKEAVAQAWGAVIPLRQGGGTRLKVLEALALGTPVVSTAKGVEGLDLKPEAEVLVAETPEAFAEQTLRLLEDPGLRERLAAAGPGAARRYDWGGSVAALERCLEQAVARRPRR